MKKGGLGLKVSRLSEEKFRAVRRTSGQSTERSSQVQPSTSSAPEQVILSDSRAIDVLGSLRVIKRSALEPFISQTPISAAYSIATAVFKQGTLKVAVKVHLLSRGFFNRLRVPCLHGEKQSGNSQVYKYYKLPMALHASGEF